MIRTHYITASSGPPNGGVPPGIVFSAIQPPSASTLEDFPPAMSQLLPYPRPDLHCGPLAILPVQCYPQPPPPYQPRALLQPPPPPPPPPPSKETTKFFEPPGMTFNGHTPDFGGSSYLFPKSHTTIHFAGSGHRPCDKPCVPFQFSRHKVPTSMKIGELILQFGAPEKEGKEKYGVTEVHEMGGGRWAKGQTFVLGEEVCKKTLAEIGWGETRVVTLCVYAKK